jgi:hypothetical protein
MLCFCVLPFVTFFYINSLILSVPSYSALYSLLTPSSFLYFRLFILVQRPSKSLNPISLYLCRLPSSLFLYKQNTPVSFTFISLFILKNPQNSCSLWLFVSLQRPSKYLNPISLFLCRLPSSLFLYKTLKFPSLLALCFSRKTLKIPYFLLFVTLQRPSQSSFSLFPYISVSL